MGCAAHPTDKFGGGDQDESRSFAVKGIIRSDLIGLKVDIDRFGKDINRYMLIIFFKNFLLIAYQALSCLMQNNYNFQFLLVTADFMKKNYL